MKWWQTKKAKIAAAVFVVVVVLAYVIVAPIAATMARNFATSVLQNELGGEVAIGSLTVHPFSFSCTVKDVKITDAQAGAVQLHSLSLDKASVKTGPFRLLAKSLKRVTIEGLHVDLEFGDTEPSTNAAKESILDSMGFSVGKVTMHGSVTVRGLPELADTFAQLTLDEVTVTRIRNGSSDKGMNLSIDAVNVLAHAPRAKSESPLTARAALTEFSVSRKTLGATFEAGPVDLAVANALLGTRYYLKMNGGTVSLAGDAAGTADNVVVNVSVTADKPALASGDGKDELLSCQAMNLKATLHQSAKETMLTAENASVDKPVVTVRKYADGSSPFDKLLAELRAAQNAGGGTAPPMKLYVKHAVARDGKMILADDSVAAGVPLLRASAIQAELNNEAYESNDEFTVNVTAETEGKQSRGQFKTTVYCTRHADGAISFAGSGELTEFDMTSISPATEKRNGIEIRNGRLVSMQALKCDRNALDTSVFLVIYDLEMVKHGDAITGTIFNVGAPVVTGFMQGTQGYIHMKSRVSGTLLEPKMDAASSFGSSIAAGPASMLKSAPDFLKGAGIDQIAGVGASLTSKVGGLLKGAGGLLPFGKDK